MTAFPKTSKNLSRRGFIGASALAPAALMLQAGEAHAAANTRAQLAGSTQRLPRTSAALQDR